MRPSSGYNIAFFQKIPWYHPITMAEKELEEPRAKMTPFGFYVFICMKEAKKKHPDENLVLQMFEDVCLSRWEAMSDFHKKRFVTMSKIDEARFNKEMKKFLSQKEVLDREKKAKEKQKEGKTPATVPTTTDYPAKPSSTPAPSPSAELPPGLRRSGRKVTANSLFPPAEYDV